jgi:hypothetical protein
VRRSGDSEVANLFRAVNERVAELGEPAFGPADLFCECPDQTCTWVLRMSLGEFEALRAEPGLYAVVPGHEQPENGDEVAGRTDGYVLVRLPGTEATARVAI